MTKKTKTVTQSLALNGQLFQAIQDGNTEEVKKLIKQGADVNARMPTPVDFLGRHHGQVITVGQAALGSAWGGTPQESNRGSQVRLDKFGKVINTTPIMHAIRYGHEKWMMPSEEPPKQHGHYEITKILIENGAELNVVADTPKYPRSIYPLLLLSLDANANILQLLLGSGAKVVNKESTFDWTSYALAFCKVQTSELYLDENKKMSSFDIIEQAKKNSTEYQAMANRQRKHNMGCAIAAVVLLLIAIYFMRG